MVEIAIFGAGGRMGQRLTSLAAGQGLAVVGAYVEPSDALLGQPVVGVEGLTYAAEPFASGVQPKVVIDFSLPQGTRALAPLAVSAGAGLVVGTTGLTTEDHAMLDQASRAVPVMQAPNMALGVNLLFALAGRAAGVLQKLAGDGYDIEVAEAHHRYKRDAPSGTALGIVDAICKATGKTIEDDVIYGREGESPREPGEIGVHALRMGGIAGEHTAWFASEDEQLILSHKAENRDVFAKGALTAAKWLSTKSSGRYGMADVLGLGE